LNDLHLLHQYNFVTLGLIFVAIIGLIGASAINVGDPRVENKNGYFWVHIPIAMSGFLAMCLYITFQTYIDGCILKSTYTPPSCVHKFRWFLCIISLICYCLMVPFIAIWLPFSAGMECALVTLVLLYFTTWHDSFERYVPGMWRLCAGFPAGIGAPVASEPALRPIALLGGPKARQHWDDS